ncbi:MAG: cytidine deaminase [Oscillospiraceae bacterium]|nr:cytidine deaminase [Oscillospiraceae bacterium]
MTDRELVDRAREMQERAYVPYSNFRVGAALLCEDGTVVTGCNVENASYGLCICGERTAMVKAVSEGHRKFKAIAIAGDTDGPCVPCGACRQFIREFASSLDMPVYCVGKDNEHVSYTLDELLAHSFGPADLGK